MSRQECTVFLSEVNLNSIGSTKKSPIQQNGQDFLNRCARIVVSGALCCSSVLILEELGVGPRVCGIGVPRLAANGDDIHNRPTTATTIDGLKAIDGVDPVLTISPGTPHSTPARL